MKTRVGCLVAAFLSLVLLVSAQTPHSNPPAPFTSAQVPRLIRFSGIAKEATSKPMTGVLGITFSLYKDQQGGAPLWMETQNVRPDSSGHYTVLLGSTKSTGVPTDLFASSEAQWLGVQLQGEAEQARVLMVSVPYALKALDAETVGGKPASAFMAAPSSPASGFSGAAAANGAAVGMGGNPALSGSGKANYVALWRSPTQLTFSKQLFQDPNTGDIGVGTITPAATLDINGTVNAATSFNLGGTAFALGSFSNSNAFLGFAGNTTTTGKYNTASGYQALNANTTGISNTVSGANALQFNTTGGQNTANGVEALYKNTGSFNTAVGFTALYFNTTGSNNTALGNNAGPDQNSPTLIDATAIGANATVSENNALVLGQTTAGNPGKTWVSVGIGTSTPRSILEATTYSPRALGPILTLTNTGGNPGASASIDLNSYAPSGSFGTYNPAARIEALDDNYSDDILFQSNIPGKANNTLQTNMTILANGQVGIGTTTPASTLDVNGTINSATGFNLGGKSFAFGSQASGNVFVGPLAGTYGGVANSAIGLEALQSNTTGYNNTAAGSGALQSNTTGDTNTADGYLALNFNAVSYWNVAVGGYALQDHTMGNGNTAVGYAALQSNTTGTGLTCIGAGCGAGADGLSNATAIGAHAVVGESNALVLGGAGQYAVKVGIGTATPSNILTIAQGAGHPVSDGWETFSSRRWKTNIQTLHGALGKVEQLRGVSYDLKASGKHEVGVIAEEVGKVVPEVVTWEKNGKDAQGVDYSRLTALLIEATKQQQKLIHKQQAQIARLTVQVKMIQAVLRLNDRTDSLTLSAKADTKLLPRTSR